jgi:hypothetical protein
MIERQESIHKGERTKEQEVDKLVFFFLLKNKSTAVTTNPVPQRHS